MNSSALTVFAALDRAATTERGIRVIEQADRSLVISYNSLRSESLAIGGALQARGLTPGSRVALVVPGRDASHATSAARYLEECLPRAHYWDAPVADQTEATAPARLLEFLNAS